MATANKTRRTITLPAYLGSLTALRKSLESLERKLREQGYSLCLIEQFHFSGYHLLLELENEELQYRFETGGQRYGLKFGEPMSEIKAAFMESFKAETK
jgi:hypothetical protein